MTNRGFNHRHLDQQLILLSTESSTVLVVTSYSLYVRIEDFDSVILTPPMQIDKKQTVKSYFFLLSGGFHHLHEHICAYVIVLRIRDRVYDLETQY